jgi:hypothetical protein
MNSKQTKILKDIFSEPPPSIKWEDIEKLMVALGARIREGKGSGATFIFNGDGYSFHRPHPQKEAKGYQIRSVKKFLTEKGVKYDK